MIKNAYEQQTRRNRYILSALALGITAFAYIALNTGSAQAHIGSVLKTLILQGDEFADIVIWKIRLPRILGGIVAGAGLAVSGCIMQTSLKNPIASPSTLGISNAAAFGANLSIVLAGAGRYNSSSANPIFIENPYMVSIFAFSFSMIAMTCILALARQRGFTPESVVLAGVAIGSLFTAGSTLLQYFADDVQIASMVFWTFGDLGRITWKELGIMSVTVSAGTLYFLFNRWNYNALDSGEATAKSLGVNVDSLRFTGMFLASLITAVIVSFVGIIGFVGLIAPQIMRRLTGEDHRLLIPSAVLTGSLILLVSDTAARTVIAPVVLPVGTITSFLGAPLFLYLLMRGAKQK